MSEPEAPRPRHARAGLARRIGWYALLAASALLGYVLVYGGTVVDQLDSTLAANAEDVDTLVGDRPERPTDQEAGEALNILVMGSDTREGDNQAVGGGAVSGMRNDTTMIVHVAADRSRVEAVSIPRDLQVEIPECTYKDGSTIAATSGDFNIAFSNGGLRGDAAEAAACTIRTVEQLTGIYIDHYAVVDFDGFISMVDALGGVPMCIAEPIVSEKAHLELEAGPQVFDGETALAYARLRTAEEGDVSGSDLQRITRQQQLLEQIAATVFSKNLLTQTDEVTQFLRAVAESLTMDEQMASTTYLVGLLYSLRGLGLDDIVFHTPPWQYTADSLNVELLPEAEEMWDDIRNDRPISVTAEGDASSAWDDGKKDDEESTSEPSSSAKSSGSPSASTTADLLDECR
ncbi:LCP family protein [Demequina mangrovi]|uniref:Transcriptional attenuator, LytR family n=1 Tax=Demequina mangrovi TaxID=1043493 RepID=A0A1H6WXE5_9MICO|nr:LCP family protein [Demequina mangrovi]SEJ20536.1 transcriptional attenuator, LytR family [Demequina mangrovi]